MDNSNIPYVLDDDSAKSKRTFFEMTPRRHELLSTYLLGFGTLFMYLGYSIQMFTSESVIHSVHVKSPETISEYAGYYGAAVHLSTFAIFTLITPSIQQYIPSKWILTLGSILFGTYYIGFFKLNSYYFYLSQMLMGIGYAFYNNGEGQYLSEHSSRRTIESNTGIETAVGHASMFFGGVALIVLCYFLPHSQGTNAVEYNDTMIRFIYGTMFVLNLFSILVFALLPTKQYDSIASKSSNVVLSFPNQIKQLFTVFRAKNFILLIPFFIYQGFTVSFLNIYPTTLSFTSAFKTDVYIIGIYSVAVGLAEALGGIFFRPLIKKAGDYGLYVTVLMNFINYIIVIIMGTLSIPNLASFGPTDTEPLLLKPSRTIVFIVGFLIGFSDFCITMARAVICQSAVPDCRMQVFSVSKLYQSLASVVVLLLTPYMTIYIWMAVLTISLSIGTYGFIAVTRRTKASRKKFSIVVPTSQVQLPDTN